MGVLDDGTAAASEEGNNYEWDEGNGIESGYECRPYRSQLLRQAVFSANEEGGKSQDRILRRLQQLGVRTYVIPYTNIIDDTEELMLNILRVVSRESREKNIRQEPWEQACLLYRDRQGRLYNLSLKSRAAGVAANWSCVVENFSGLQALVAISILFRSLPCASAEESDNLEPLFLAAFLGLVLQDELSLPWINVAIFVRGMPSIAAHSLTSKIGSDWSRKIVVFCLILAAAASGNVQRIMTLIGIILACCIMLVNLGSRAWFFLKWRPLRTGNNFGQPMGFICAMLTGLFVPYMGFKEVEAGGKAAMEKVILSAFVVYMCFLLSDFGEIQKFIVVGRQDCDQEVINVCFGFWWMITLLSSLLLVKEVPPYEQFPEEDEEPVLEEDQTSPVGYRVPDLPTFPIDPGLGQKGITIFSLRHELALGIVMAFGLGILMIFMAFSEKDNEYHDVTFKDFSY